MWARFRAQKVDKDKFSSIQNSFNVNEEYMNTLRTQSYVDFYAKAQLLVNEPSVSPKASQHTMELLLEPEQDLIPSILESLLFPKVLSDLKLLMLSYFDTSAEASKICNHLLRNISETHSNYQFIQRVLERFDTSSPEELKLATSELDSFSLLTNPFSNPDQLDFKLIHDRYSSILHHLNLHRKKVTKRMKLLNCIKKASGVCLTAACSVVALVAIGIAIHSISGLLMGPILLGISPLQLRKKFSNLNCFRSQFLRKLGERLDVAAKGTYILHRDFDTMSRLVARIRDEVEHKRGMVRYCLERRGDKFPLQEVVKELRKSGQGFKQQVEELEEHVFLCLLTINRARVLVIKEMSAPRLKLKF